MITIKNFAQHKNSINMRECVDFNTPNLVKHSAFPGIFSLTYIFYQKNVMEASYVVCPKKPRGAAEFEADREQPAAR